jgi:hypothetical protein
MRGVGLNGKSVMPMISGFACAVPAIMSARNIENRKERTPDNFDNSIDELLRQVACVYHLDRTRDSKNLFVWIFGTAGPCNDGPLFIGDS